MGFRQPGRVREMARELPGFPLKAFDVPARSCPGIIALPMETIVSMETSVGGYIMKHGFRYLWRILVILLVNVLITSEELAENPVVREKYLGRNFIFHRKKFL